MLVKGAISRIVLRKILLEDAEKTMSWRISSDVTKYMYTDPELTLNEQENWIEQINNDSRCRYWIIENGGVDIGVLGLTDIDYKNKRSNWIWYIGEMEYRGTGIAQQIQYNIYDYAFYHLGLNRLYSEVFATNIRNLKAYEKSGYYIEGILKEHVYKNGKFHDVAICGITRGQWEKMKSEVDYNKIYIEG